MGDGIIREYEERPFVSLQRGLAGDLLKGVDRQTAKLVIAAAAKANCRVHLTQLFVSMVNKLEKTPKKRFDQARGDFLRLAQAIISSWPLRASYGYSLRIRQEQPWFDDFANKLLKLGDQSTVADFFRYLHSVIGCYS